jgi:hypothetical protein
MIFIINVAPTLAHISKLIKSHTNILYVKEYLACHTQYFNYGSENSTKLTNTIGVAKKKQ